jgi:F-type H+-transporting ATPase subunit epsilon
MMAEYSLRFVTGAGDVFSGNVESLVAPGQQGLLGVLAHHAPLISLLKKGVVKIRQASQEYFYVIQSGILEIDGKGKALILTDTAVALKSENEAQEYLKKS